MFSTHDFRVLENGATVCAACYRTYAGPRETVCPGSQTVHFGPPAPCGASGDAYGTPNCTNCIAIVAAAPPAPEHDFRIYGGFVACARCGGADPDILEFGHCSLQPLFTGRTWPTHATSADGSLCGAAPYGAQASGRIPATCPRCLDGIRELPPIRAVHDPRLAGEATACAACGLAAPTAAALGSACDGGVFIDALARVRGGGDRGVREFESLRKHTGNAWSRHLAGCRHFRGDDRADGRTVWRVTCLTCLRRLASAPPAPAP